MTSPIRFHPNWRFLDEYSDYLSAVEIDKIGSADPRIRKGLEKVISAFLAKYPEHEDCSVLSLASQGNRRNNDGLLVPNRPTVAQRSAFLESTLASLLRDRGLYVVDVHHGRDGSRSADWTPSFAGIHGLAEEALPSVASRCRQNFRVDIFITDVAPRLRATANDSVDRNSIFNPIEIQDERRLVPAVAYQRIGQSEFRSRLILAYGECAVTGVKLERVLHACHIIGYRGPSTNVVQNGLLLRADVHLLFDSYLLWIDPDSMSVRLSDTAQTDYGSLDGTPLCIPTENDLAPSPIALELHAKACQHLI